MPPPPPPPGPPPPPSLGSLPAAQPGRKNLLADIERGKRLKKTVTNDRSGPFIENGKNGGPGSRTPGAPPVRSTPNPITKQGTGPPSPIIRTPIVPPTTGPRTPGNPGTVRHTGAPPTPPSQQQHAFVGTPRPPPTLPVAPNPAPRSVRPPGPVPGHTPPAPVAPRFRPPGQPQPPPQPPPVRQPVTFRSSDDSTVRSPAVNPNPGRQRSHSLFPASDFAPPSPPGRPQLQSPVRPNHNGFGAPTSSSEPAFKLPSRSQAGAPPSPGFTPPQTQTRPNSRPAVPVAQPTANRFQSNGSAPPPPPPRGTAPLPAGAPPLPPPRGTTPPALPPPRQPIGTFNGRR